MLHVHSSFVVQKCDTRGAEMRNRPLDFERTREGPVFEKAGEMSLHQRHRGSR